MTPQPERFPDATDVFIDGDAIRLSLADERRRFRYPDFPGLTPRRVEAAGAAAAVFAGVESGPTPPARPLLSVKIPPDLRVTFVRPPATDAWHVDVPFRRTRALTLDDYVRQGVATEAQVRKVQGLLAARKDLVVSGGTGASKTTFLRALPAEVADTERLVVIEDTPELAVPGDNVVQLQTTLNVDLATLLRQTLRLNPDRIEFGEVRGPEALKLVRAMNTGHDGSLCTLHSNGAAGALRRLHTLVAELPVRGRGQRGGRRPAARGKGRGTAPGRGLARVPGRERNEVRAVSRPAPRSHGPAEESASLLKPLVEKGRAADHGAAPAQTPGPALSRAVTPSGGDQHDLAPAPAHPP